jgi:thioredoxin reductase
MADTELLVIGAGPYAYSAAAYAQERGIPTRIIGRPMGFWRDQMPVEMYLRSGRDWSLDAALVPRLKPDVVHTHARTEVVDVSSADGVVRLTLSDAEVLEVDHVTCASGYRADLAAVPYLSGVIDRVSVTDGFPDLSPGFETTLPGLFVTGFASTRDFGPFYGFTKGCPSAARIAVDEMLR